MKKLLLQTLLIASVLSVKAQIMMEIGDKKYDISTIDSILFVKTELPSATTIMNNSGEYSIFAEALRKTGLADSLLTHERGKIYEMNNPTDRDHIPLYYPQACNIGFTLFAEKDDVLRAAGINSFNELAEKCKEWYGNPTWYDLIGEQGIKISTGNDFTNEWNVVHMFVAYHIIRVKIQIDHLVYERNTSNFDWNYCFGYEPQAYYETMLKGTLLKIWQTNPKTTRELWINRYLKNNTLTDQYATFGSEAMHPLIYSGARIYRDNSLEALNACIHSIDKVLLYDQNAHDAQHERMRFHVNQMLPELGSNGFMRATQNEISILNGGGNGLRMAFPTDYFDNLHFYSPNAALRYCVMGPWRALESTQIQGWNENDYYSDFAIRLPRVPSGRYEIRYLYPPMSSGGEIEFYIGNDSTQSSMKKLSALNTAENPYDGNMGYEDIDADEEKYGIESGKAMRQKGFMYAPASFSRGTYNIITDPLAYDASDPYSACRQMTGSTSCRTEGGYGILMLRYIVATVDMKQGQDCWLRLKVNPREGDIGALVLWNMNFIELVPTDVADNAVYMEDWY